MQLFLDRTLKQADTFMSRSSVRCISRRAGGIQKWKLMLKLFL